MKRKTFSILFFIRKARVLRNSEVPIYVRITVDGQRAEATINRSIDPEMWNTAKGCGKPLNDNLKGLNHYLEQQRHRVYQIQQELEDKNKVVTASTLRDALVGKGVEEPKTILQIYKEHNARLKLMIGKGFSALTHLRHETSMKHVGDFIQHKYHKPDFYLRDVNKSFINDYEAYLRTERNCCNNTTVKYLKNFNKIIRIAIDNEWLKSNPFKGIKHKLEEVDKPFLTKDELDTVMNKKLTIPRIEHVRDVFVFCCLTGLAFVYVKSLSDQDLEVGQDGNVWIKKQRQKTKQWAHIPLLPMAKRIIEKYRFEPICMVKKTLLPVYSNQKMNGYLKEVGDLCGITKNLTTHCARHTFATTVTLANHISMESVSKMLGHASINMTKHYARILDTTIGKEMSTLVDKFSIN
jgi:site-specific recombinase XerD